MSTAWKTVRVFISSTFRDMHAERDHLVTVVFPELRERLSWLGLDFYDIDLRWGVPTVDVDGERANPWEYCRRWIDAVEPLFVTLLGQRYGYIPLEEKELSDDDKQRYEGCSITEMEIRHAFLNTGLKPNSFFYFRDTSVPEAVRDQDLKCYEVFVDSREVQPRLNALKAAIMDCGRPVRKYTCTWQDGVFTNLEEFGNMVRDDLWSAVIRDERYVPKDAWHAALDGKDPETHPYYRDAATPVPDTVWKKIVAYLHPASPDTDAEQCAEYIASVTKWFQGRAAQLLQLEAFVGPLSPGESRLCAVMAPPGQGKSALLAAFIRNLDNSPHIVIPHFVGVTEKSVEQRSLMQRCLAILEHQLGRPAPVLTGNEPTEVLRLHLASQLTEYDGDRRIVIVVDAVNEFIDGQGLSWLPRRLGPNVRVIISCPNGADVSFGSPAGQVHAALNLCEPPPSIIYVPPLDEDDVRCIVTSFLQDYCKELTHADRDIIAAMEQAKNPLYLLVMLHELRTLGGDDMQHKISERVASMANMYPTTLHLFDWVLQRLADAYGAEPVGHWFNYLLCGRKGMAGNELAALLARRIGGAGARVALRIERAMRRYLKKQGRQWTLCHDQMRQAVRQRYPIDQAAAYHHEIADYFETQWPSRDAHALSELPYHQLLGNPAQYLRTMIDFTFLHTKVLVLGPAPLLDDYNSFLDLPQIRSQSGTTDFRYLDELRRSLELSAHILDRRREEFPAQLVGRLRDSHDNPFVPDLLFHANQAARKAPHLLPRTASLIRSGERYLRSLIGHHGTVNALTLTRDQRYLVSSGDDGRLVTWDLGCGYRSRELANPNGRATTLTSLDEPHLFVAGSSTGMLSVWDTTTGLCTHSLRVGDSEIWDLCALGGGRVAAADMQGHVIIWNTRTQAYATTSPRPHDFVNPLAAACDGAWVVSGHKGGWVRIWDTETGALVREFQASDKEDIADVVVLHRAPYALTTSKGVFLRLWDLSSGVQVREWMLSRLTYGMTYNAWNGDLLLFAGSPAHGMTMDQSLYAVTLMEKMEKAENEYRWKATIKYQCENNPSPVVTFVLADGGEMGFSGNRDGVIRQWDLRRDLARSRQERHTRPVRAIALVPGQERVVTGAGTELSGRDSSESDNDVFRGLGRLFACTSSEPVDYSIRCWDARSGICESTLTPHGANICRLAALPDRKTIISTADDGRMAISQSDGAQETRMFDHVGNILAVSSDGVTVVSEGEKHALALIDTSTGVIRHSMQGHRELVTGIVMHPDQQRALSAAHDGHVMLWDLVRGTLLADVVGHKKWIEELKLTPDGCYALTTCHANELRMWQIGKRTLRKLAGRAGFGRLLAIRPDGQAALARNSEGIRLWSLPDINSCCQSTERLSWAEFLPDGSTILGLHTDGYLLLLGAAKLDCLASYTSDTAIRVVACGGWQRMVAAGDDGGRVHFLDLLGCPWQLPLAVQIEQHKWWGQRRRLMLCPICGAWTQRVTHVQNRCAVCGQDCRIAGPPTHVRWHVQDIHKPPI